MIPKVVHIDTQESMRSYKGSMRLTALRSRAMRLPNDRVQYTSTSSDSPQPCSSKSSDMVISDTSKSTDFVFPLEVSTLPPKHQDIEVGRMGLFL
ncbi:hypothetical protein TNCV_3004891 [Trichonephila clavipes]|nr:hypothetical protein TNCV_3004891 [Trichonephila clavipes]